MTDLDQKKLSVIKSVQIFLDGISLCIARMAKNKQENIKREIVQIGTFESLSFEIHRSGNVFDGGAGNVTFIFHLDKHYRPSTDGPLL